MLRAGSVGGGGGGGAGVGLFRRELVEAFEAAEAHVKSGLRSTHRLADGVGELCVATRAYDDALRRFLALQADNDASGEAGGESDDPVPAVQRMLLGLSATVSAVSTATHSSANLLQVRRTRCAHARAHSHSQHTHTHSHSHTLTHTHARAHTRTRTRAHARTTRDTASRR